MTVEVALAIVWRDGRVLVAPRAEGSHLEGLWEFPGGKVEAGEEPHEAALRELREETGLTASSAEPLSVFHYAYPDRDVRLHAFVVREFEGEPSGWEWTAAEDLGALPMPEANRAILKALKWRVDGSGNLR